jgi:hypothetical protein
MAKVVWYVIVVAVDVLLGTWTVLADGVEPTCLLNSELAL